MRGARHRLRYGGQVGSQVVNSKAQMIISHTCMYLACGEGVVDTTVDDQAAPVSGSPLSPATTMVSHTLSWEEKGGVCESENCK